MTAQKKPDSQLAVEIYNRTRIELMGADLGAGWLPSAVDRLAAVVDPKGALAKLVAAHDMNAAALSTVLKSVGIMSMRGTQEQTKINTRMME